MNDWLRYTFSLLLCVITVACWKDDTLVNTTGGEVYGGEEDGHRVWRGIPFGAPPIGKYRWTAPIPITWAPNIWNATYFRPSCPQNGYYGGYPVNISEDCLYLNIWSPINVSTPTPVMVWIYGGQWTQGEGNYPLYYGDFYANSTNTVVVTINYRVGALGFLSTAELQGNWGIMDQQLALRWINKNIASFGGDPSRVTIFGQSAGAISISTHMTIPTSFGLFQGAIMESNPFALQYRNSSDSEQYGTLFAAELLCDVHDVDCLRSRSMDAVLKAQKETVWVPWPLSAKDDLPWQPTIDGILIVDQPLNLIKQGRVAPNVSVIVGTVKNETASFVYEAFRFELPIPVYTDMIKFLYKENASLLLEMYVPEGNDGRNALSRMATDFYFTCPSRRAAMSLSQLTNTYLYSFLYSADGGMFNTAPYCDGLNAACHGSEIQFVFHSAPFLPNRNFHNQSEAILSWNMLNLWAEFAHNGKFSETSPFWPPHNINGKIKETSSPSPWPLYNIKTDTSLALDLTTQSAMSGYHSTECDYWDHFY